MKRIILAVFHSLFFTAVICAQDISGIVFDNQSGEAMIGVTVAVKGTTTGTATDIDGRFNLKITQPLPVTLVFSYVGYSTQEFEIKTRADLKRSFTVKLKEQEKILNDVEVVDTRITQKQMESPLTVESMGLQAIKQTAASTFYEGLSTLKGVDMTTASMGFVIINTRGFNSTSPVRTIQLLDGADNQAPGLNFSMGNFAGATEIDIQKVDLIVGASSALYGPNAFNGVIDMQTKNPYYYNGLTIFVKGGERDMFEGAVRYAKVFKNKYKVDKFAFKVNGDYLRANDWPAENYAPATNSWQPASNPGGYDAVNRYGDELLTSDDNNYNNPYGNRQAPGLGQYFRTGYLEKDLVNYNARNIKANALLDYKITDKIDAKASYNFGTGTTVYQGDDRYSLNGLMFNQVKAEISQPDKFFIRAYVTTENSGHSYDAVNTALKLQDWAKSDTKWAQDYERFWENGAPGVPSPASRVNKLPGFPSTNSLLWITKYDSIEAVASKVLATYNDSLVVWHQMARAFADTSTIFGGRARLVPGTAAFNEVFDSITSLTTQQGGTEFYDRSKMVHIQGEYKFSPAVKGQDRPLFDVVVGGSFRVYLPNSQGTIFSDTLVRTYARDSLGNILHDASGNPIVTDSSRIRIINWEAGLYGSISRKFDLGGGKKHSIILTATCRVDKNENFAFIATPAASLVYSYKGKHMVRLSFTSAIRNPTLQDQYLYYNTGQAILVGNLKGFDSLVTLSSLQNYLNATTPNDTMLKYENIPKVRPEKVQSLELGYKGLFGNKVFVDASAYVSYYRYFLGYVIGSTVEQIGLIKEPLQVYRVAANAQAPVLTYGVSVGVSYYFIRDFALNGNYSWNVLNKLGYNDSIIPAFNTPEHKFNIGISGYNIKIKSTRGFGFNINYKWIDGFTFQGSPQFTGSISTYSMLDAQISWNVQRIFTTFKLGGSNLVGNLNYQAYGGPGIGRLVYGSILFDIPTEDLEKGHGKGKTKAE